jgi:hypothetical protein
MGNTRNTGYLQNAIKVADNGNISLMHGSTMLMQISSSGAITTTGVISGSNALSASFAATASTAASAVTASFVDLAQSASNAVSAQTASFANALTVAGTLTAQTLVVQTITSSVDFVTGSTRFGSVSGNTHVFTGSMSVSGTANFIGNIDISNGSISNDSGNKSLNIYGSLGSANNDVATLQLTQMWNGRAYKSIVSAQQDIAGGPASSALVFKTSFFNGTDVTTSERMRITTGGNVGIGTDTPLFGKLSIVGTDNTTISSALWGTSAGAGLVASVYNASQTTDSVAGIRLITRDSGASVWNIYNISRGGDNGDLAFGNGAGGAGTEKLRILNNGNVGIGTNSPQYKTQITSTSANSVTNVLALHNGINPAGAGTGARLLFKLSNFESSAETRKYASIEGLSTSDYNEDIALVFKTKSNNADPAERMRIYGSGGVVIEASSVNQTLTTGDAGIARTNSYFGTGQVRIGGGADHASNTVLSVAPGVVNFDAPGVGGGRLKITSDGITQVSNLRTSTMYSEYTKNLSGAYSAGTFYEIVNSSQMASGIYILRAYIDTYAIGGGTYFITYASVPFYFYTGGTNNTGTQTFPTMLGSGHAGYNPPIIRLRLSSGGSGGLTYLEFDPNANWSNVTGGGGATVTFFVKRLGD